MKNITLSADAHLIQLARKKALKNKKTLNALFRQWLMRYVKETTDASTYLSVMDKLHYVKAGKSFTRDERNAR